MTTLRNTNVESIPNLPTPLKYLKQVHGTEVICVDELNTELPEADAAIAFKPGSVCVVKTADCLPILICDMQGTQVAAIHAGWRGLAAGVISTTCKKLSAAPQECLAWFGPAIGAQAFEVGHDVIEGFLSHNWNPEIVTAAFQPKPSVPDKWLGDLCMLARHALQQHGFALENIYGGEWCTYSDPARFDSYRRDMDTDRMKSLIWLQS